LVTNKLGVTNLTSGLCFYGEWTGRCHSWWGTEPQKECAPGSGLPYSHWPSAIKLVFWRILVVWRTIKHLTNIYSSTVSSPSQFRVMLTDKFWQCFYLGWYCPTILKTLSLQQKQVSTLRWSKLIVGTGAAASPFVVAIKAAGIPGLCPGECWYWCRSGWLPQWVYFTVCHLSEQFRSLHCVENDVRSGAHRLGTFLCGENRQERGSSCGTGNQCLLLLLSLHECSWSVGNGLQIFVSCTWYPLT